MEVDKTVFSLPTPRCLRPAESSDGQGTPARSAAWGPTALSNPHRIDERQPEQRSHAEAARRAIPPLIMCGSGGSAVDGSPPQTHGLGLQLQYHTSICQPYGGMHCSVMRFGLLSGKMVSCLVGIPVCIVILSASASCLRAAACGARR